MKNLTTPQSILFGFGLVALAIASIPYSSNIVKPAFASNKVHKIAICDTNGSICADIDNSQIYMKKLMIRSYTDNRFVK